MNRGELWTVSGGVYAAKPRPAIIIQDDLFTATDSVIVIPLTTTSVTGVSVARIEIPTTTGLAHRSFAMIDKVTTVRRSNLGARIGRIPTPVMVDIERSVIVMFGLAS